MEIPHTIHQIWSGKHEPLPKHLAALGETWKYLHPDWEYRIWDEKQIVDFILKYFPQYKEMYDNYIYDVQRWDVIRYLILYQLGGVYVDFDYECLESIDTWLEGKQCCFSLDPEEHAEIFNKSYIVTNALMAAIPGHPFVKKLIEQLALETDWDRNDKFNYVLNTTGPYMVTRVYDSYENKNEIFLFPSELTSPFTKNEVVAFLSGTADIDMLEAKLQKAIAIHYFLGSWYS